MTRRILTVALVTVLACSLSVSAQTPRAQSGTPGVPGSSPSTVASATVRPTMNTALALLRTQVEDVNWLDTPFEDVVDWLKGEGEGQVNVVPRWAALSVESIDRESLVTLQLNNTTVAEVLNEVMRQLSDDAQLRYRGMGNTLRISTKSDFDRKMYVRVYDVTDILFRVPDFGEEAPLIDLQQAGRGSGGGGGGGGGGQSVFQGSSSGAQTGGEQDEDELEERLEELRVVIEEVIEPDSWDTLNGGPGRIRIFNLSLIVYNTIEVHELIAGHFSFD